MILFGSIIPLSYQLKTTLYNKKLDYYASEVALDGAKILKERKETKGTKIIDEIKFDWNYDGERICVTYEKFNEKVKKCINRQGEN